MQKRLWIGMVEFRPLSADNEILGNMRGAFANLVTWASDADGFKRNAELIAEKLGGLFVSDVVNPEPVEVRRARTGGGFGDELEDMISRALGNPNAIIYGKFHMFEKDDA